MQLIIAAIGKMRDGPEASLTRDYIARAERLGRQLRFAGPRLLEFEAPKSLSGLPRQAHESETLIKAAGDAAVIALDERGHTISSEGLAGLLTRFRDDGTPALAFLIGGADGHGDSVHKHAVRKISFGPATWPHLLVRVMLTEQIYRSMTILKGHPYHRS